MATLLTDPYDFWIVASFKRYMSKFHDILIISYSSFSDPSFVTFKTMDKEEFRVLIKHCFFDGEKYC